MKHFKTTAFIVLVLLAFGELNAQESLNSAWSEAAGAGGSVSYSVGQLFYTSNVGNTGSIAQGVHQPYEISEVLGIDEISNEFEMSIYPNPTRDYLTLTTEDNAGFSYQLYDINGRIIESNNVTSNNTTITMQNLPSTTYFLKVTISPEKVRTYKIIKN